MRILLSILYDFRIVTNVEPFSCLIHLKCWKRPSLSSFEPAVGVTIAKGKNDLWFFSCCFPVRSSNLCIKKMHLLWDKLQIMKYWILKLHLYICKWKIFFYYADVWRHRAKLAYRFLPRNSMCDCRCTSIQCSWVSISKMHVLFVQPHKSNFRMSSWYLLTLKDASFWEVVFFGEI